jgi:hypothetical protein
VKIGNKVVHKTSLNEGKSLVPVIAVGAGIVGAVVYVSLVGRNASKSVQVAQLKSSVYKNQPITLDMLQPYDMLQAEYDKQIMSTANSDGTVEKRLVAWKDVQGYLSQGAFAAYQLPKESFLDLRTLMTSRVDNSDSVLYSFPGKEVVQLEVNGADLNAFKTFIQPGDKVNIDAIYSEDMQSGNDRVKIYRSEPVFTGIMIADIINSSGASVLDMYAEYNAMSEVDKAALDNDATWQEQTEPSSLLVALTPDEKDSYYKFLNRDNVKFKVSLPQRAD